MSDVTARIIQLAAEMATTVPAGEDLVSPSTPQYVRRRVIKALDQVRADNCRRALELKSIALRLRASANRGASHG